MSLKLPENPTIVISRTDSIGDMILTLPMAGIIKQHIAGARVVVVGREYTRPVVACSPWVDHFFSKEELMQTRGGLACMKPQVFINVFPDREMARLAKDMGIPYRIGTSHRWYHWLTCNKLVHFSRKGSNLHESQLNLRLLEPLGISPWLKLHEIEPFAKLIPPNIKVALPEAFEQDNFIILHPKSRNSAREWPLQNFYNLAKLLSAKGWIVAISGTKEEGQLIWNEMPQFFELPGVVELTGRYSLDQFIKVIDKSRGLVACSTGPLHIAAALGRPCVGIYPPIEPMHPGRWAPLGPHHQVLVKNKQCGDCRNGAACHCVAEITPGQVMQAVEAWPEPVR